MKIGIILTPDERSKAYLQKILDNKIKLEKILFMNDKRKEPIYDAECIIKSKEVGFDISEPVKTTLKNHNLEFNEFDFVDINNYQLIEYISKLNIPYFIFTGGGILKKEILNCGPKFIHLHPGLVPQYRGSTCFYYSIINEDMCGVTAYFMDEKLDTGDIIYQKKFIKPNHRFIDDVYDAHIRSETLLDVLKNNMILSGKFTKQNPDKGESYYIIHPVLKHIAILNCISQ